MMFVAWDGKLHRPTQDVDLLGYGNPEVGEVVHRIREICAESVDDGIAFDLEGIRGEKIREDAEYEGIRVRVPNNWFEINLALRLAARSGKTGSSIGNNDMCPGYKN